MKIITFEDLDYFKRLIKDKYRKVDGRLKNGVRFYTTDIADITAVDGTAQRNEKVIIVDLETRNKTLQVYGNDTMADIDFRLEYLLGGAELTEEELALRPCELGEREQGQRICGKAIHRKRNELGIYGLEQLR